MVSKCVNPGGNVINGRLEQFFWQATPYYDPKRCEGGWAGGVAIVNLSHPFATFVPRLYRKTSIS